MEKNQEVTKPMATVPMMAIGIMRSGLCTSSAMWVAQSRQAKAQLVLTRPTMKAMPPSLQPVLLMKVAKTNLACWCVGAVAGTVIRMTTKERRDV